MNKQTLRSKYMADLRSAIGLIEALASQQAMSDNWYIIPLTYLKASLKQLENEDHS